MRGPKKPSNLEQIGTTDVYPCDCDQALLDDALAGNPSAAAVLYRAISDGHGSDEIKARWCEHVAKGVTRHVFAENPKAEDYRWALGLRGRINPDYLVDKELAMVRFGRDVASPMVAARVLPLLRGDNGLTEKQLARKAEKLKSPDK